MMIFFPELYQLFIKLLHKRERRIVEEYFAVYWVLARKFYCYYNCPLQYGHILYVIIRELLVKKIINLIFKCLHRSYFYEVLIILYRLRTECSKFRTMQVKYNSKFTLILMRTILYTVHVCKLEFLPILQWVSSLWSLSPWNELKYLKIINGHLRPILDELINRK